MKIKAYEEHQKTDEPLYLRLETNPGGVDVIAVNAKGDRVAAGAIMRFDNNGHVVLYDCVNEDIGLCLDDSGRIKTK